MYPRPADVKVVTFLHLFTSPLGDEEQRMISVSRRAFGHKNFAPNPLLFVLLCYSYYHVTVSEKKKRHDSGIVKSHLFHIAFSILLAPLDS